jgi:cell division protein FtsB
MRRFDFAVTLCCCSLLGYFAWHAWQGPRGFRFAEDLEHRAAALETRLAQLSSERLAFEQRVSLLRPESLDPDLLDELARGSLNMARPGELVVVTGK